MVLLLSTGAVKGLVNIPEVIHESSLPLETIHRLDPIVTCSFSWHLYTWTPSLKVTCTTAVHDRQICHNTDLFPEAKYLGNKWKTKPTGVSAQAPTAELGLVLGL